ncbi:hypothetical protein GCM10017771_31620 [Streptomyces capitiformicae]|uniref:Integrase catalytic domain-containing protein n=1 Tax=Streptomyces capitiformicae TaxID=2014920 RepID=A0A919L8M5_9ACTN|nr:hypothetical protein GCM10017771_31620 [Streptomyces capitiformicae]
MQRADESRGRAAEAVVGEGFVAHEAGDDVESMSVSWLSQSIAHTYIKPRTPRLNGKAERSHHIDAEEFYRLLDGVSIDYAEVFNDKLREWEDNHNYHRPRGGRTPYARLNQKTTAQA